MTRVKTINIILILLVISTQAFCQKDILQRHLYQFEPTEAKTSFKIYTAHNNEAEQLASVLFLFYKKFISSQDYNSCVFTPSCSVYAMESIKKLGFLVGYMSAFDRLTRCSGLAAGYYPIDPKTHLNYDPVP
jgi:uncharacterized protein